MSGMGDGYVGTAQDAGRIRRLEAERKRTQDLKKKSAEGQGGLLLFGSGTSEVPSGNGEKTRSQRKRDKKKERSNKPAESEAGDTKQDSSVTPPSHPHESRMIFFQYAESSMNLEMVVREGFDSSPESLEMKQLCYQVSTIYCDRLRIPSSVSNIVFNFTTVASDYVLVSLKDDEVELGFEEQLKTCRESNADKLLKNEAFEKRLKELEVSVLKLQGQAQLRAQPQAELQAKVADLKEQNTALKLQIDTIQLQMDTIQLQIESLEPLISQLLVNVELQYNTRCRILVQEAQKRLFMKLGLEKEEGVKWEDFVKSLSSLEKVASGATEDMLQLMGTRMCTLNTVVHIVDSNVEMVHAVNNIRNNTLKTTWQALFTYVYDKNPEHVEFKECTLDIFGNLQILA